MIVRRLSKYTLIAFGLLSSTSCAGRSRPSADVEFYDKAMDEISRCLISGRDCAFESANGKFVSTNNHKDECFASISTISLSVVDVTAKLEMVCTIEGKKVQITAAGDRQMVSKTISEPVVTIRPL